MLEDAFQELDSTSQNFGKTHMTALLMTHNKHRFMRVLNPFWHRRIFLRFVDFLCNDVLYASACHQKRSSVLG